MAAQVTASVGQAQDAVQERPVSYEDLAAIEDEFEEIDNAISKSGSATRSADSLVLY